MKLIYDVQIIFDLDISTHSKKAIKTLKRTFLENIEEILIDASEPPVKVKVINCREEKLC